MTGKCPFCGLEGGELENPALYKLHVLKCAINRAVPMLEELMPPPFGYRKRITPLVDRAFQQIYEDLDDDVYRRDGAFKDKNFPRLLQLLKTTLTFICEYDPHYRMQLAYFCFCIMDIFSYEYERFDFKKHLAENLNEFKGLSLRDPKAKALLFLHYIGQHSFDVR